MIDLALWIVSSAIVLVAAWWLLGAIVLFALVIGLWIASVLDGLDR